VVARRKNRGNVTPVTVSTRVWPGRKIARMGTYLGAWVGEMGPERDVWRRRAAR
jgi:hypothetical protein